MNKNGTIKNLCAPWAPGRPSPNPTGRPRRLPISEAYASLADEPITEEIRGFFKRRGMDIDAGLTYSRVLAHRVWISAILGNAKSAIELRESIEGKAAHKEGAINVIREHTGDSPDSDTNGPELVPDKKDS